VAYGLSVDIKIGDLEWPWTALWPSLRVISHKTAAFWANCVKFTEDPYC